MYPCTCTYRCQCTRAGTVRRYLERFAGGGHTLVVLVVDAMDAGIYEVLMPLYFPRDQREEECARYQLPVSLAQLTGPHRLT